MTRTIHGIDPYAPGGLTALIAHHYATFGDAVMEEGAGGEGGAGAEGGQQEQGGTQGAGSGPGAGEGQQQPEPKTFDEAYVKKIREEAATNRAKARDAEAAADLKIKAALKALGINDEADDPVKAAQDAAAAAATERDAARATARDTAAELIIWRNAKDLGINPQAITDSVAFNKAIAQLDPSDADAFAEAVKTAATTAATNNPMLKAAPAAGAGGADFTGGTGEAANIDAQIAAAEKAGDHAKAISLKRQKAYSNH